MKKAAMIVQLNMRQHLRKLVGGVAVVLISGIAIGSLPVSDPGMQGNAPAELSEPAEASTAASRRNCAECGAIVSTREIEGHPLRSHEITVRMQDGSLFVITDPYPANWKKGERVKIIAGVYQ